MKVPLFRCAVTASARMCLDPTDVSAMMDTQVNSAGFTSFRSGCGQPVARVLNGNPELGVHA